MPETFNPQPGILVPQVISETSPAAQAGIRQGDVIVAANGAELGASEDTITGFIELIKGNPETPVDLTLQRGTREFDVTVVPEVGADGTPVIGVQLQPNGEVQYRRPNNPIEVFTMAAQQFQDMLVRTVQGFASLITNFNEMASQVAGPVKIVEQGAGLAQSSLITLFPFTAIISINLAIIKHLAPTRPGWWTTGLSGGGSAAGQAFTRTSAGKCDANWPGSAAGFRGVLNCARHNPA